MVRFESIYNEKRICAVYDILRCNLNLTHDEVAQELLCDADDIYKLSTSPNESIPSNMLFHLYYMANETLKNRFLSEYVSSVAEHLKNLCTAEIGNR